MNRINAPYFSRLRWRPTPEFIKFSVVGASGTLFNLSLLFLLVEIFSMPHIAASILASESAILHNFLLNNYWTFSSRSYTHSLFRRGIHFNLISIGSLLINVIVFACLTSTGISYMLAQVAGILTAFTINYLVNNHLVFKDNTL